MTFGENGAERVRDKRNISGKVIILCPVTP